MSVQSQIVFIDIPSKAPRATWSPNPWKTRFLLNYKGLDYKTEWVEYPDLRPRLEKHHRVQPNNGPMAYTSPTIMLPDGSYIMDSRSIAGKIEELYPSPPVFLDSPVLTQLEQAMGRLVRALAGVYLPLTPVRILTEASQPYWYQTREKWAGMPLEQLARENGGAKAWTAAQPHLDRIAVMLGDDASDPYFMGQTVSYADFVWGGFLIWMQRLGDDVWRDFLSSAGKHAEVHERLLGALGKWSDGRGP